MQFIDGGITAPAGFTANGIHSGLKESRKTNDLALFYSTKPCVAAGVFTSNRVQAECVKYTKKIIEGGIVQAGVVNVCYANACTGAKGAQAAKRMAESAAKTLNISPDNVVVCSTGVIGQQLPVEIIERNMKTLTDGLSVKGHEEARTAIMTTDTKYKECAVETEIDGKKIKIGAMCKGSGMIHINMGTMLAFVTTDCNISREMLDKALRMSVERTYNCVSVDGDMSTNDTLLLMANGLAGNKKIESEGEDFNKFYEALNTLNTQMAMKIAADGEGASHLLICTVNGAKTEQIARGLAKSVISSSLVKAAHFGSDANWGRILCSMGYSGFEFNPEGVDVFFKSAKGNSRYFVPGQKNGGQEKMIQVCSKGATIDFDEGLAKEILSEEAVEIIINLEEGTASANAYGCDLTYDYVKINGDYRS